MYRRQTKLKPVLTFSRHILKLQKISTYHQIIELPDKATTVNKNTSIDQTTLSHFESFRWVFMLSQFRSFVPFWKRRSIFDDQIISLQIFFIVSSDKQKISSSLSSHSIEMSSHPNRFALLNDQEVEVTLWRWI